MTHIGTTDQTLEFMPSEKKRQSLNILEHFCIYNLSRQVLQMNDNFADIHNPIFALIIKTHPSQ